MPSRYSNVATRNQISAVVTEMEEVKRDPVVYRTIAKKQQFEEKLKREKETLERITPPDTTSGEKDRLRKRLAVLEEAIVKGNKFVPPMPNERTMQTTVTGGVDHHLTHESFWKKHNIDAKGNVVRVQKGGRGAIFEWKDLRRILMKGHENEAPNAANIELLRPKMSDIPLADCKEPRSYGFTPEYRRNYDSIFVDHVPTDVEKKIEEKKAELPLVEADALEDAQPAGDPEPERQVIKKQYTNKGKVRVRSEDRPWTGEVCQAKRTDGTPCGGRALPGRAHCFVPSHAAQFAHPAAEPAQPAQEEPSCQPSD